MASRRIGATTAILAAGTFVAGLVVGGIGPRGEVRRLETEVFELQRDASRAGNGAGRELATLITQGLDGRGEGRTPSRSGLDRAAEGQVDGADPSDGTEAADREGFGGDDLPGGGDQRVDDEEPLLAAREMLQVRRDQAYRALVEQASPSEAQQSVIDGALDDMNAELADMARELVQQVTDHGEPGRREMMVMGADVLDLMVSTEDRVLEALSPDQRADLDASITDPTSFVDPQVIDILQQIEGFGP